jgi:hypothetical protein
MGGGILLSASPRRPGRLKKPAFTGTRFAPTAQLVIVAGFL